MLPADKPRYLILIMLDEPQPIPETKGYATSGWNAVPVAGLVIGRVAPLLGIEPRFRHADGRQADPGRDRLDTLIFSCSGPLAGRGAA